MVLPLFSFLETVDFCKAVTRCIDYVRWENKIFGQFIFFISHTIDGLAKIYLKIKFNKYFRMERKERAVIS